MWQMPSVSKNPQWRGRDSLESGPSGRGVTVLFGSPNVIGPGYSITACLALTTKKNVLRTSYVKLKNHLGLSAQCTLIVRASTYAGDFIILNACT